MLIDKRLPLIDIGSSTDALLIAESVVATIEIKSHLDSTALASTIDSIAQTLRLERKGTHVYRKGQAEIRLPVPNPILAYVFAYNGTGVEALLPELARVAAKYGDGRVAPDAVCVLGEGVLLRTPLMPVVMGAKVFLPPIDDMRMNARALKKDALLAFYRRVVADVVPLRMESVDLDAYYADDNLE